MDNGVTLEILVKMGGQAACSLDGCKFWNVDCLEPLASFLHRFQAEFKSGFGSWLMTEAGRREKLEGISWNRYLAFCFLREQELICHFLLEANSGSGDAGEEAKAKATEAFGAARLLKEPHQF